MEPKYKKPQIYRIIKNGNDTFYFEVKKNKRKFGINIIEYVLTDLVLFLLKNFMEINNNFIYA